MIFGLNQWSDEKKKSGFLLKNSLIIWKQQQQNKLTENATKVSTIASNISKAMSLKTKIIFKIK